MKPLTDNEIKEKLANLSGWNIDGKKLTNRYKFKNFVQSLEFVNKVGKLAESHNHHPDIEFGWGYAVITFTTHDAGGLTELDFKLAQEVDNL
jgi:4a-hydroxytetrahydrobiopterin dehydratase